MKIDPGGIDSCIVGQIKYAGKKKISIIGITSSSSIPLGIWGTCQIGGVETAFLPVARFARSEKGGVLNKVPHSVRFARGLIRYRKVIPDQLCQAHRIETGMVLSALQRRYVQFLHNDSTNLVGNNSDSRWKNLGPLYAIAEKVAVRNAEGLAVFNRTYGQRLLRVRSGVMIAQTWFDPELFFTNPQRPEPEQGDILRVCWVGRFEQQKDPLLAVQTLFELRQEIPNARMTMIGSGSLYDLAIELARKIGISDALDARGAQARPEVAKEMRSHDVFLITSHYEGSPTVVVEAQAAGLPVVATFESDPDELLEEGTNGIRVKSRDPKVLARKIVESQRYDSAECSRAVLHRSAEVIVPKLLRIGIG
ncbi:glycosyltransferase family 4 protein [Rhodococcus pseudokoreensis]|uniref:Glycosyltransferase family 4 protein n=1 Tax=Rhodococcus pseudokoreensis TaxID=2811421 RepID=A0A974ZTD9_9NOCA|nr:glycosyltransferase family 4 protein [Rhodococcus pseudokoreensis]QSE89740.1 glycosyltransferase family 4 protein [Rhodococcus pseudokoreensis]